MRDIYTRLKKTLAHFGPRFDGLDSLVAYRACFWTKYRFFPRPPAPDHKRRGQYILFHLERGIVRVNQIPLVRV
jgi:hypothetical protein